MRQAQVFYQYQLAGLLTENEEGYFFVYESQYLENPNSKPVSLTLPLQKAAFQSKILFPFFDVLSCPFLRNCISVFEVLNGY